MPKLTTLCVLVFALVVFATDAATEPIDYRAVMGGETAFGGNEVVVVMAAGEKGRYSYRLLATSKTSTMQKELQEATDAGFEYKGQTVFNSAFGGDELSRSHGA